MDKVEYEKMWNQFLDWLFEGTPLSSSESEDGLSRDGWINGCYVKIVFRSKEQMEIFMQMLSSIQVVENGVRKPLKYFLKVR